MGRVVYYDLEILNGIGDLRRADCVILHGVAEKGQRLYRLLNTAGVKIDAFYDRNAEMIQTFDNISVFSLKEMLYMVQQRKGTVYVISCISQSEDSWDDVQKIANNCESVDFRFVSYWAISFSVYMHRFELFDKAPGILEEIQKENAFISTWMSKHALAYLEEYNGADEKTIWLLQPGKVGSTSILNQIRNTGIRCIHSHVASYPEFIFGENYRHVWEDMLAYYTDKNIKIITMVREPIERDYSSFWQAFSEGKMERIRIMPNMKGNLQELYNSYTNMILEGRRTMEKRLGIATPWTWVEEFMWFDEHFGRQLGVDIYKHPFDRERGYEIVTCRNYNIFIGKLEKLHQFLPALKNFVGNENIQFARDHSSAQKWFSMAYKEFIKRVQIPEKYYIHYYEDNERFKHFYSDEEITSYRHRWEKQVVR